ncbi:MAG: hypothetical protein IJ423_02005 [Clostridia bacterium]|nr:hypothetical protein [Clostridia bacterium]
MTVEEVDKLFEVDDDGKFTNLVLPNDKLGEEIDLIGKRKLDLDIEIIVRIKKYADKLYEDALSGQSKI